MFSYSICGYEKLNMTLLQEIQAIKLRVMNNERLAQPIYYCLNEHARAVLRAHSRNIIESHRLPSIQNQLYKNLSSIISRYFNDGITIFSKECIAHIQTREQGICYTTDFPRDEIVSECESFIFLLKENAFQNLLLSNHRSLPDAANIEDDLNVNIDLDSLFKNAVEERYRALINSINDLYARLTYQEKKAALTWLSKKLRSVFNWIKLISPKAG